MFNLYAVPFLWDTQSVCGRLPSAQSENWRIHTSLVCLWPGRTHRIAQADLRSQSDEELEVHLLLPPVAQMLF